MNNNSYYELYEKETPTSSGEYVRIKEEELRALVENIFENNGLSKEHSKIVTDVLVSADLMGISSHGVQRVNRYIMGLKKCCVNPRPEIKVVREIGATAVIDADAGLGHIAGLKAMDLAIEKAKTYGTSLVLVKNSQHFGIAGYYALKAIEKKLIGVAMTNSESLVSYVNTVGKTLGTNPIAIAIPKASLPPILFDAATSIIPVGKVEIYAKEEKELPHGWVLGDDGKVISKDSKKALEMIKNNRASLLPLGGIGEEFGGHKGSGLAFIIDIITGVLSGAAWGIHVGYTVGEKPANVGHAFAAVNIESFMELAEFEKRLEKYIEEIKSLRKIPNADSIWIPGEKAWYTMQTRKKIGIPLHKNVCNELNKIALDSGINERLNCL
ncbi:Ldh family oxidoreductase [Fervidicoccus fontis]|uniref:Ldh family oxidoreductase n=1 Tax=Fervidicoccus fontis TaxID=683846 RepID=A0A2J6N7S7_9CREN|nr:Ldh family oxidoreductase [Fervidicoccus fontis]MBE9390617.1 Ldh family oxidoreductase [Fervidicoccus fontis]PMB75891.1 MAG: malate dehydrogenase [Fervidicoccus fontis]PMB77380.1 MAG: malate dehydrogenase [Fervidicoccus fontis]HEW63447.1 Ldh family oxidoreductase [Fervidicoccus fontis]